MISGSGIYFQMWDSAFLFRISNASILLLQYSWHISEIFPHSILVLKRPAVKNMADDSHSIFSLPLSDFMIILQ